MIYIILILSCIFHVLNAERVVYNWTLSYKTIIPDGLHERRVISINDQWPPLPIKLNVNDTLVLVINNKLNEPTSLHAHGILHNQGTNLYDGVSMVTQCPISNNDSFVYKFPVNQAGTFWIHSHYKVQYMDGLRVPLIVYDKHKASEYDQDEVITVSDWYHQDSYTNLEQYMNKKNMNGIEPIPQSGLINDHVNATISFQPGKTYRLRLINMSGIASFDISIDDHEMQVIEVDGVLTEKANTKSVYLGVGQRISVLVKTKESIALNYYLRANMDPDMFDLIPNDLKLSFDLPIYYDRTHQQFSNIEDSRLKESRNYDDAFIEPFEKTPALKVDRQIVMTIDFRQDRDGLNRGTINGISYTPPYVPTLHTVKTIGKEYVGHLKVYGPHTNTFLFELDQVIEVVINNADNKPHPFHLHGHVFQVVARGQGKYQEEQVVISKVPTVRDTAIVPANGYLVIRFKANNPGVWFFHCHIDWHIPVGLASTFITAPELVEKELPSQFIQLCEKMGLPSTGNSIGKQGIEEPTKSKLMLGAMVATLVGISTIIWHVWVDPGEE